MKMQTLTAYIAAGVLTVPSAFPASADVLPKNHLQNVAEVMCIMCRADRSRGGLAPEHCAPLCNWQEPIIFDRCLLEGNCQKMQPVETSEEASVCDEMRPWDDPVLAEMANAEARKGEDRDKRPFVSVEPAETSRETGTSEAPWYDALYVPEGFVWTQYQAALGELANSDNSFLDRAAAAIRAADTMIPAYVEEYMGRPLANTPYQLGASGTAAGEAAARAVLHAEQGQTGEAAADVLSVIQHASEGLVSGLGAATVIQGAIESNLSRAARPIESSGARVPMEPASPGIGEKYIANPTGLNVDAAFQKYSQASKIKAVNTGGALEAAHLAPTSAVKGVSGYSRGAAETILLPREHHRAFDRYWMDWARQKAATGATETTVSEFLEVQRRALESVPQLRGRTGDTMYWKLYDEYYNQLGLSPEQKIRLPYAKCAK